MRRLPPLPEAQYLLVGLFALSLAPDHQSRHSQTPKAPPPLDHGPQVLPSHLVQKAANHPAPLVLLPHRPQMQLLYHPAHHPAHHDARLFHRVALPPSHPFVQDDGGTDRIDVGSDVCPAPGHRYNTSSMQQAPQLRDNQSCHPLGKAMLQRGQLARRDSSASTSSIHPRSRGRS